MAADHSAQGRESGWPHTQVVQVLVTGDDEVSSLLKGGHVTYVFMTDVQGGVCYAAKEECVVVTVLDRESATLA